MICLVCGEDDLQYFIELLNYDGSIKYVCGLCNGTYTKPTTTIKEPEPETTTTIKEPEPEPTTTMKPEPEKKKPVRIIKRKKITTKKKCNKCNVEKSLSEFHKCKTFKDGLTYDCKECRKVIDKKYNKKYRKKIKEHNEKYYKENKEKLKERNEKYYKENKEKIIEYNLKYIKENKERIQNQQKQWYKENKEKIQKKQKQWYKKNKERLNEYTKQYNKENPHYVRWRSILHRTLKYLNQDKTSPTEEILGYSAIELKQHLDNLGMNWETHHIDHIIPLSWFKKDTPIHLVNDLRNLQPLLEHENKAKSDKFTLQNNQEYISEVKQWIKDNKLKNLK